MTLDDISPDKLAILEAKLRADLETVQKMRALMLEHAGKLNPTSAADPTPVAAPAPVEPPPVKNLEPRSDYPPGWMPYYVPPPTVKTEVRSVVAELKGPFKFGVVKTKVLAKNSTYGDTSIRSVLMRMVHAGELKIVQQGYGRGGSTFQKSEELVEVISPAPASPVVPDNG
jgi:hypothetical protein